MVWVNSKKIIMGKLRDRLFAVGMIIFLIGLGCPLVVQATVGWEVGDIVLDFGLDLESGEQAVLVDKDEVGHPFFVELTWKLSSVHCLYYQWTPKPNQKNYHSYSKKTIT